MSQTYHQGGRQLHIEWSTHHSEWSIFGFAASVVSWVTVMGPGARYMTTVRGSARMVVLFCERQNLKARVERP